MASLDVLVLGIGNILLKDEGVGVRAVEALEGRYHLPDGVEIVDGGTAGFELLGYIRDREHLIVVDAIAHDQKPGTVIRVEGEDVRTTFSQRISPHQLGISDVLAASLVTGEPPRNLVLFGIEPKDLDTGLELSEEVSANFDKLIHCIVEELTSLGCKLSLRSN